MSDQYAYSRDGEMYYPEFFPTADEAARAGFDSYPESQTIWVGLRRNPTAPEFLMPDADDVIEHVSCQDDYSGDWADRWCSYTKEEAQELTTALQKTFADWLDRTDNRPQFFNIDEAQEFTREAIDSQS